MLEYCRGPIPTMLPFGLLDSFASTLDFHGIKTTFSVYTRCTLKALLP
jgi:C-8 sterol isomerase